MTMKSARYIAIFEDGRNSTIATHSEAGESLSAFIRRMLKFHMAQDDLSLEDARDSLTIGAFEEVKFTAELGDIRITLTD